MVSEMVSDFSVTKSWNSNMKVGGRPPGRRMPCGWGCGAQLAMGRPSRIFTFESVGG
jgi:hypothetical protein